MKHINVLKFIEILILSLATCWLASYGIFAVLENDFNFQHWQKLDKGYYFWLNVILIVPCLFLSFIFSDDSKG